MRNTSMHKWLEICLGLLMAAVLCFPAYASEIIKLYEDENRCGRGEFCDMPDLVVSDIWWPGNSVAADADFWIGIRVDNIGTAYAGGHYSDVYLRDNDALVPDHFLGSIWITQLYPGQSTIVYVDFRMPCFDFSPVYMIVLVEIDIQQHVHESDESNIFISGSGIEVDSFSADHDSRASESVVRYEVGGTYARDDAGGCFLVSIQ